MNPSYFRIKLPKAESIKRLCDWNSKMPKEAIETTLGNAVTVSLNENGQWKGSCLYVYENDEWTVFEDLSGGYSDIPIESWKNFSGNYDLVVAGYNDAVIFAELKIISNGMIQKDFLESMVIPEDDVNIGALPAGIDSWTDVAAFVDDDEIVYSEHGTVLIF